MNSERMRVVESAATGRVVEPRVDSRAGQTVGQQVAQAIRPVEQKVGLLRQSEVWRRIAQEQARRLLAAGSGMQERVKHLWRVRPSGERSLHTVVTWDGNQTLGDVVLGEFKL